MNAQLPNGPLDGLKVLDFTTMMSGPIGTKLLADMGADVVKVEAPTGDQNRGRTPSFGGMSRYFSQLNAGKRSIVLDLKDPADLRTAVSLAARADVLVENNRPGVMARLGLGYDTLSADNSGLVYCSISGFGQDGPAAGKAAYAPNVHATSGYDLAQLGYQDDRRRPANTAIFVADAVTGIYAITAIQAALLARHRTGRGQFIDVALHDSMLNLMVFEVQAAQLAEPIVRSVFKPMPTADGFVSIAMVNQKQFVTLMDLIGRSELVRDERFATVAARELVWDELMDLIAGWTCLRSTSECTEALESVAMPVAPYRTVAEVLADPDVAARGALAPRHDDGGEYVLVNAPFRFADGSVHTRGIAPGLGADGDAVVNDWMSDDQVVED